MPATIVAPRIKGSPGASRAGVPRLSAGDNVRYQAMSDVLIRDVPEHVLAAIDARARRLGLSRTQYLRRKLVQDAAGSAASVTGDDLRAFAASFTDLADDDVMAAAWK